MDDKHPALAAMRSATRTLHEQLESTLTVARPGAGRDDFVHYLQDMWGWLSCFEVPLWQAEWPAEIDAGHRDGKLAWIESDLRAAGLTPAAIASLPVAAYRPMLDTPARRFGVAYVIEGAQLGTRVLARRFEAVLGGWMPRWLQGYGEDQARYWRSFTACAENMLDGHDERREAAAAAAEAFASLAAWFALRQQTRGDIEVRRSPGAA